LGVARAWTAPAGLNPAWRLGEWVECLAVASLPESQALRLRGEEAILASGGVVTNAARPG